MTYLKLELSQRQHVVKEEDTNQANDNSDGIMKCGECQQFIYGVYVKHEGKILCERCYEKYRKKCSVCGENVMGTYYYDADGKIVCQKDYRARMGGRLSCRKCGKEIEDAEMVKALGGLFHEACFVCSVCRCNLAVTHAPQFMSDEKENIYCVACYQDKFAPRCAGCKRPIVPRPGEEVANLIVAMEQNWHPACFVCADCRVRLGGKEENDEQCYPLNNLPLCYNCHMKRIRS